MRVLVLAILYLMLPAVAHATPFHKGASLQIYTFPALANGRYADNPYPERAGAAEHFQISLLPRLGLDHVRLPVDVGPLLEDPEGRQWEQFQGPFVALIEQLHRAGLGTIVTLVTPSRAGQIPENQLDGLGGERFGHYARLAERFASELGQLHIDALALEPMNEPQQKCTRDGGEDWTVYQDILIDRLHAKAPDLWLGLTGGCWSKIEGLVNLRPESFRHQNTFISVHFYEPFLFTHQGSDWTLDIMPLIVGLPYPLRAETQDVALDRARLLAGEKARSRRASEQLLLRANDAIAQYFRENNGPDSIRRTMDGLAEWCVRHNVPASRVILTEFGAMKSFRDDGSRGRWLHDVSSSVESRGWGWTLWVLRDGPFGMDDVRGLLDPAPLQALGLKRP